MANQPTVLGPQAVNLPADAQANRPASPVQGMIRYNTDIGLAEIYTSNGWTAVDAPPVVSNWSGVINTDTSSTITVNGSNFKTGSIVSITDAGVSNIPRVLNTTFVSTSQLTADTNAAGVNYVGGASFGIRVTNPSGLSGTLSPAGNIDRDPVWNTAAGSLGTFNGNSTANISLSASDPDGSAVTFAITSGSLPSGLSLNTSTGAITGTYPDITGTSTFTITATSNGYGTPRSFSITTQKRLLTVNGTTYYNTGSTQNVTLSTAGTVYPMTVHNAHNLVVTAVGASGTLNGTYNVGSGSGRGGSVTGTYVNIPAASNYYLVVGASPAGSESGYPGGAIGGSGGGAGGGGFSGFWRGTSNPLDTANRSGYLLIGGGGGSHSADASITTTVNGDGGYPNGEDGNYNSGNRVAGGGTQAAGGVSSISLDGTSQGATAGTAYYGGQPATCGNGGGGGGGGWYGGGGGAGHCGQGGGAGGGGSSYYNASFISSFSYVNGTRSGSGYVSLAIS